jgi:hypothetical protein
MLLGAIEEGKKMKHEWRKKEKEIYIPKNKPELITIPAYKFFTIEGKGNPNDDFFAEYIGALYSLAYAVRMSPKAGIAPENYFEYTVYPLEGVWDISEEAKKNFTGQLDKDTLIFNLMIRQPDFVTDEYALEIIERTKKKKPHVLLDNVKFEKIQDGDCIQMMHLGNYDNEPESFKQMEQFCKENNLTRESKQHREIYLSDVRKASPEKLKTVLRFKVKR